MEFEDKIRMDRLESKVDKLNTLILQHEELIKCHTENFKETLFALKNAFEIIKLQDNKVEKLEIKLKNHNMKLENDFEGKDDFG